MPTKRFADMVITRLRVEKMEGGVVIAGRSFHTSGHCPVLVLLFACCFLVAGVALTVLSYRPLAASNTHYLRHLSGSQVAGPCLVAMGLVLLGVGLAVQLVARRLRPPDQARHRETRQENNLRSPTLVTLPCRCFNGWSLFKRRSGALSRIKRKRMIDDLMSQSSQIHYKVNFGDDTLNSESRDVASFPDSCFVSINGPASKVLRSSSPLVKIKTVS